MKNKQNQTAMTSSRYEIILIVCLIAGLVVGTLIGLNLQVDTPQTEVEDTETYQPRIVELEGYNIEIVEYVDLDTGLEYLLAVGPLGLAMCPKV